MPHKKKLSDKLIDTALANQALNSANDGITIADMLLPDQPLIFINKAFEKMTGYKKSEIIGKNCRFLQGNLNHQQAALAIIREAIKNQTSCRVTIQNVKKNGSLFWNELSLAPITDANGKSTYYVGVQKDITNEVTQKERIVYLSEHDDLTGLYNYRSFFRKIDDLIAKITQVNLILGIGIADVNFFKKINDQHGHLMGNTILKILGTELTQEFSKEGDIVARFGGDEFCFAIIADDNNPAFFYERIAKVVNTVNSILSKSLQITMSSGIIFDKGSEIIRIDRLIHQADTIMYRNKQLVHLNNIQK